MQFVHIPVCSLQRPPPLRRHFIVSNTDYISGLPACVRFLSIGKACVVRFSQPQLTTNIYSTGLQNTTCDRS